MNNWGTLPHKILRIIILYLNSPYTSNNNKNDLAQCALTCRGWRVETQSVYFHTLRLYAYQLNTMNRLVSNNFMLGSCVKKIYLMSTINRNQLTHIDTLLPKLQVLRFHELDKNILSFFYKMVIEGGKFGSLKEIPNPSSETECESYLRCCMLMKNRINCISFEHDHNSKINAVVYECLHDKLHQFPYLKEVRLFVNDVEESRYCIWDYLESITKNGINSSIQKYSLILFNYYTANIPYSTKKLNSVLSTHPSINIKELNLEIGLFYTSFSPILLPADKFVLYIMKKFPHLNSIRLNNRFDDELSEHNSNSLPLEFNRKHVSKAVAITFLKYVSKLSYGCVEYFISSSKENMEEIIQGLYADVKENSTSPLPLRSLEMLYRPTRLKKVVQIGYHDVFIDFEVNKNDHRIRIRFNKQSNAQFFQQQLKLIEQTHHFFTHIELEISTSRDLSSLFKHVAEYCIQLNNLIIFGSQEFKYYPFTHEVALPKNHNIKKLTLNGSLPSLEQLEHIITQLPCLKTLVLYISPGFEREGIYNKEYFASIHLPDTSLDCLELHIDQVGYLFHPFFRKIDGHDIELVTESNKKTRRFLFNTECPTAICDVEEHRMVLELLEGRSNNGGYYTLISNLRIYCKSVKKFIIKYLSISGSCRVLFSEEEGAF